MPPSSSATFFTVRAHCAMSSLPTGVEPVNESLRTLLLPVNSPPISTASPVTTLKMPAGMPARCASSAIANAENGVCGAGLITIGQPAPSAGAALRVIIAAGKFHGVIAVTTPIGWRSTMIRLSPWCPGMMSP